MNGGNNHQGGNSGVNPDKVNPMSPNFMNKPQDQNSAETPSGPMPQANPTPPPPPAPPSPPSNPPAGGTPQSPTPPSPPSTPTPPPPPPKPPTPPPAPSSPASSSGASVPPPPPKEVDIRTMSSDSNSLKQSGGTGPTPQSVKPIGKSGGPKKLDSVGQSTPKASGGGRKRALLIGLGIIVFLAAAAAVANYFVLPIFLSDSELEIQDTPPVVEEESEPEVVIPTVPSFVHESYFQDPVDASVEVNLSGVTQPGIDSALNQTTQTAAAQEPEALTEFYFTQGLVGDPVTSDEFLAAALPDVAFPSDLEEDFTGFLYTDADGAHWSGYVFALGAEADMEADKELFQDSIESSNALTNLFLSDPGTPSEEGFKDGITTYQQETARWIQFSEEGYALNYGWKGRFVVVSTSFNGFKAALSALGDVDTPAPDTTVEDEVEEDTATTTP